MHPLSSARAHSPKARDEPPGSLPLSSEGAGRDQQEDGVGRGSERASGGGQERAAEHERRRRRAIARALLSAAVLCVRDKPPGSPLLSCEGAGMDGKEDGAASELEEGRSG